MSEDIWIALPENARKSLQDAGINDLVALCSLTREQVTLALGSRVAYYDVRDKLREHGLLMRKEPTAPHIKARLTSFESLLEGGSSIKEIAEKEGYSRSTAYTREAELGRERARMRLFRRWEEQMLGMSKRTGSDR